MRILPSFVVQAIEETFPWAALRVRTGKGNEQILNVDQLTSVGLVLSLAEAIPTELLPLDPSARVHYAAALGAMRSVMTAWSSGTHPSWMPRLSTMESLGGYSPITCLLAILRSCPDDAPAESVSGLDFIPDEEVRLSLRTDIGEAYRALADGEFKASSVLAGSVIEALLLWALKQRPDEELAEAVTQAKASGARVNDKGPEHYHLPEYIAVSEAIGILDAQTATATRLAADFRNLIHPGRVLRAGRAPSHATALTAVAAMQATIELLEKRPA